MPPEAQAIPELTLYVVLARVGLALATGLIVGAEREKHGRAAGLRTTVLVCVAACIAMLISEYMQWRYLSVSGFRPDPARLAAGVLTGMGFLGAAGIMRHESAVRGVTTAAMLWFVTVLGLAYGCGEIVLGLIGLGIAILALFVLTYVERHLQNDWYAVFTVTAASDGPTDTQIREFILGLGVGIQWTEMEHDLARGQRLVRCELKLKRSEAFELSQKLLTHFGQMAGVREVKWHQEPATK